MRLQIESVSLSSAFIALLCVSLTDVLFCLHIRYGKRIFISLVVHAMCFFYIWLSRTADEGAIYSAAEQVPRPNRLQQSLSLKLICSSGRTIIFLNWWSPWTFSWCGSFWVTSTQSRRYLHCTAKSEKWAQLKIIRQDRNQHWMITLMLFKVASLSTNGVDQVVFKEKELRT